MAVERDFVVPDYSGACVSQVVPAVLRRAGGIPGWMPEPVATAAQVVLLVLDGLGWEQLRACSEWAPTMSAMAGGPIATVAPSTTATALTSLATGTPPARHGVVGYRVRVNGGDVLNVLRWKTGSDDARERVPPESFQPLAPFDGIQPPIVTRSEFSGSGFTRAHLDGTRLHGWRMASTLVVKVRALLGEGEPFIYAYYDGVDKVAHEYGLGDEYRAELRATDRLVAELIDALPPSAVLLLVSDHGQVDVGGPAIPLQAELMALTSMLSGEGRFRWLHAWPGKEDELRSCAEKQFGDQALVATREELVGAGWFGGELKPHIAERLGDVALVAHEPVAFFDASDTGDFVLRSRHGSLTEAEMWVPLLAASG